MMRNEYRCPNCEETRHYRSLCRSCTEYDEQGKVLNAVSMLKVGSKSINKVPDVSRLINDGRRGFRVRRKPTKKQLQRISEEMGSLAPPDEGQFTLLAESDDSEE